MQRRQFLKSLGVVAVAVAVPSTAIAVKKPGVDESLQQIVDYLQDKVAESYLSSSFQRTMATSEGGVLSKQVMRVFENASS